MKIDWTDAACDQLERVLRRYTTGYAFVLGRSVAREILNAATAEQFRPETDKERADRYEAALTYIWHSAHATVGMLRDSASQALKPRGGTP